MRDYASLYSSLLHDLQLTPEQVGAPITSDMDARLVGRVQMASVFYKKLCPTGSNRRADEAALKKFLQLNQDLPTRSSRMAGLGPMDWYILSLFRDNLCWSFGQREGHEYDLDFIREHMDVGPGSAQKADSRSFVHKVAESPLSYTNDYVLSLYRAALVDTGIWAEAEMLRNQKYGVIKVEGMKLFFAPKTSDISRTCGTEASVNMLLQKSLGAFFEERLSRDFGIDLSKQADLNGELARRGSIDGSFGTIDLSSASDSIGLTLLDMLPDCFIKSAIKLFRSEVAVLPDGSSVKLNMVSTMGNGFTFPFQTLVFACLVRACYTAVGLTCSDSAQEFAVFGDDIIVKTKVYPMMCRMLYCLGFDVNTEKSFGSGRFRESCGKDWYNGYNVRGVYIRTLEDVPSLYSCLNRVVRWSSRHDWPLHKTVRTLMAWLPKKFHRVPPSESDSAGVKVPFAGRLSGKVTDNYWFNYRAMVERAPKVPIEEDGSLSSALGFLSGRVRRPDYIVNDVNPRPYETTVLVNTRLVSGVKRFDTTSRSIPYWDYLTPKNQEELVRSRESGGDFGCSAGRELSDYGAWQATVVVLGII